MAHRAMEWHWSQHTGLWVGAAVVAAAIVRGLLLPTPGWTSDLDEFVGWAHHLTVLPFGRAYDQPITFGPVMVYIWGLFAAIDSNFRSAVDSSEPAIRVAMKLPAVIADLGLALGVAYGLRANTGWAVIGAVVVALHPALIDTSAWWGQYDSIYVLAALVAVLLALSGRTGLAAAALAVAVVTKPQAIPFLVPFAAWSYARDGAQGVARAGAIASGVALVLWLPFMAAGGPANYLATLGNLQNGPFALLSLNAWNLWWLLQIAAGGYVSDTIPIVAGLTDRLLGFVIVAAFELVIARAILRAATPRALVLGLAASTLAAFSFLTTMHERYAFAALIWFALLLPDARAIWASLVFGVVFTLDLLASAPPIQTVVDLLPSNGIVAAVGSVVMVALALGTLAWLIAETGRMGREASDERDLSSSALLPIRS